MLKTYPELGSGSSPGRVVSVEVLFALGDIIEKAASQARLAKDFRNLIHPGRELRTRTSCDRGAAHAAFAALHLVIRDLENSTKGAPYGT